jgi:hypothetical protein
MNTSIWHVKEVIDKNIEEISALPPTILVEI